MALQMSANRSIHNRKLDHAESSEMGIELPSVAGNIYESLEGRERDSHTYVTASEASATTRSTRNNDEREEHSNGTTKRVAFTSLKVEVSCWMICLAVAGMLLFCMISCALTGVIVYNVIDDKMSERQTCESWQGSTPSSTSTSTNNSDALAVELKQLVTELNDMWSKQIDSLINNQSESRDYLTDINRRLEASDNASLDYRVDMEATVKETVETLHTVTEMVEIIQEKQNTSNLASSDYRVDIDRRLEALQIKHNISGQQVAFTVHTPSKELVDYVPIFSKVILNLGDGYNQTTGKFTCPTAGLYQFAVTLLAHYNRSGYLQCYLRKNGTRIAQVYSYEGRYDSASVVAALHLSVGDVVDLQCYNWHNVYTALDTVYTGMLVNAD